MKIYIAGPMTGIPDWNFPAFYAMQEKLEELGYDVENPASNGGDKTKPWEWYLKKAITKMLTCDCVMLLPGWIESSGVSLELYNANKLGIKVVEKIEHI